MGWGQGIYGHSGYVKGAGNSKWGDGGQNVGHVS
jgi:hypothetical protein